MTDMRSRLALINQVLVLGHLLAGQRLLLMWALLRADDKGRVRINKSAIARECNLDRWTVIRQFEFLFDRGYLVQVENDGRGLLCELGSTLVGEQITDVRNAA